MVWDTQLMHRIDKDFGVIWVHKLVNTVAKVEYVTGTRAVTSRVNGVAGLDFEVDGNGCATPTRYRRGCA